MINSVQFSEVFLSKSLLTNIIAVVIVGLSFCFIGTPYQTVLWNVGFYALSCALTNWIAVIMLFDKIPFLYGSGVIPTRFEEVKKGIKSLVMSEFFTQDNISNVLSKVKLDKEKWQEIANEVDYDKIYDALVEGILESKIGAVLSMMGGQKAVEPLREGVQIKLKVAFKEILSDDNLQQKLVDKFALSHQGNFLVTIEKIIDNRLANLTPNMVKEIIQKMIRHHLGWLVVWGGVFGGFIGLVAAV